MIGKNSVFKIVIIILAIVNFFWFYKEIKNKERINILTQQVIENEKKNWILNFINMDVEIGLGTDVKQLAVVAFFSDNAGSLSDIRVEIKNLNSLHKKFPGHLIVYYLGNDEDYLSIMGARFSYIQINIQDFNDIVLTSFPLVLLLDKNNTIHYIHQAGIGGRKYTVEFYKRVNSLFESIYGL